MRAFNLGRKECRRISCRKPNLIPNKPRIRAHCTKYLHELFSRSFRRGYAVSSALYRGVNKIEIINSSAHKWFGNATGKEFSAVTQFGPTRRFHCLQPPHRVGHRSSSFACNVRNSLQDPARLVPVSPSTIGRAWRLPWPSLEPPRPILCISPRSLAIRTCAPHTVPPSNQCAETPA